MHNKSTMFRNSLLLGCFLPWNHSVTILFTTIYIHVCLCSIYLLACNGENGTLASDTPPPTGLEQYFITLVACPASSRRNRPVPSLATLSSSPSHLLRQRLLWSLWHRCYYEHMDASELARLLFAGQEVQFSLLKSANRKNDHHDHFKVERNPTLLL